MRPAWRRALAALVASVGTAFLLHGAYVPAKAWAAQVLLEAAWARRMDTTRPARPWPWADFAPLARLRQPRLGIDQIVLDDASARTLAFGPGHVNPSARPGEAGNLVISAHRDTHFRWLSALRNGDELLLEGADGVTRRYAVSRLEVRHESEVGVLDPLRGDQLRLLTCYPFDALRPGTPLRYLVTALPRPS